MAIFIVIAFILIICSIVKEIRDKIEVRKERARCLAMVAANQDEEYASGPAARVEEKHEEESASTPVCDSAVLMKNALTELGCQPEVNNDGILQVAYQGEYFLMEFRGMYARVWDMEWSHISESDPAWPKLREAINATNYNFGPTVLYSRPNDEGIIGLHTRRDIILSPAFPDNKEYVRAVLNTFFTAKEQVRCQFVRLNEANREGQAERRPVGFSTTTEESE